jgi:hypothetical protein
VGHVNVFLLGMPFHFLCSNVISRPYPQLSIGCTLFAIELR